MNSFIEIMSDISFPLSYAFLCVFCILNTYMLSMLQKQDEKNSKNIINIMKISTFLVIIFGIASVIFYIMNLSLEI